MAPFPASALLSLAFLPAMFFAGVVMAPTPASDLEPGDPVVLVLHGRGLQGQDTTFLRRSWRTALNDGLERVGADIRLDDDDLRLVWYADALDPRARGACETRGMAGSSAAAVPAGEVVAIMGVVGSLLGLAADWVGELEALALRSLAGDLLYFGEAGKRCAAEERLAEALAGARDEGRPVILVAHSFGSLVAWSHLATRDGVDAPRVERLVTIGSLVGYPELRELLLGPGAHEAALPGGVGSWVNVRDPMDPMAAPLMTPGGRLADASVSDRTTVDPAGPDPHDAARYLSDRATARAILESWCGALDPARAEALGCPAS